MTQANYKLSAIIKNNKNKSDMKSTARLHDDFTHREIHCDGRGVYVCILRARL